MIPKFEDLKQYTLEQSFLDLTKESLPNCEKMFIYFYHDKMTQDKSIDVPGLFDFSSTMYVSKLAKDNMSLFPNGAKDLIIIGPPYENLTTGSHVNRLLRCLLNPLSNKILFNATSGCNYYDISVYPKCIDDSKVHGFAALLLNNTLQVIQGTARPTQGSIKEKYINEAKEWLKNLFTSSDKQPSRLEILKKAQRLLIYVKVSKEQNKEDDTIISVNNTGQVSLQQIGLAAALGIYSTEQHTLVTSSSQLHSSLERLKTETEVKNFVEQLKKDKDKLINSVLEG